MSNDERSLLLSHTSIALLDRKPLRRPPFYLDVLRWLLSPHRISPDSSVSVAVHLLDAIGCNSILHKLTELLLVGLFIILQQGLHVIGDMLAEDVTLVNFGVVLFALGVETGKALVAVRDVDAAIDGALQRAEDLGAGRRAGETDVKISPEGTVLSIDILDAKVFAVGFRLTFVDLVETILGQDSPSDEETRAVGSGVVR